MAAGGGVTGTRPGSKASRQAWVAATLRSHRIRSQEELAELLRGQWIPVTQATLSRDLDELGAIRVRAPDGALVYALPGEPGGPGSEPGGVSERRSDEQQTVRSDPSVERGWPEPGRARGSRLARVAAELLVSAEASANLVVLRTPAGAAQFLASVIDHAGWSSILGTVAGDDTVLLIARDPTGGGDLAEQLLALVDRRRRPVETTGDRNG